MWLIIEQSHQMAGMRLPAYFALGTAAGDVTLSAYISMEQQFNRQSQLAVSSQMTQRKFRERTYSRVGLMGNPSDGFGKFEKMPAPPECSFFTLTMQEGKQLRC